jgi:hypothetical protein
VEQSSPATSTPLHFGQCQSRCTSGLPRTCLCESMDFTLLVLACHGVGDVAGDGGLHLLGVDHDDIDVEVVFGHEGQVRIHY